MTYFFSFCASCCVELVTDCSSMFWGYICCQVQPEFSASCSVLIVPLFWGAFKLCCLYASINSAIVQCFDLCCFLNNPLIFLHSNLLHNLDQIHALYVLLACFTETLKIALLYWKTKTLHKQKVVINLKISACNCLHSRTTDVPKIPIFNLPKKDVPCYLSQSNRDNRLEQTVIQINEHILCCLDAHFKSE